MTTLSKEEMLLEAFELAELLALDLRNTEFVNAAVDLSMKIHALRSHPSVPVSEEMVRKARGAMQRVFVERDPEQPMPSLDELARAALRASLNPKGE